MLWLVSLAVLTLNSAPAAMAQETVDVRPGLMWNKRGLPAVFPLQVRTAVGQNYFLNLSDAETDEPALAAFIEGGSFFRVLVPPGRFTVRFAYGRRWQGEDRLFGPESGLVALDDPLEFFVTGFNRKSGHVIDLTSLVPHLEARIDRLEICQGVRLAGPVRAFGRPKAAAQWLAWNPEARPVIPRERPQTVEDQLVLRVEDRLDQRETLRFLKGLPRFEVRGRPC